MQQQRHFRRARCALSATAFALICTLLAPGAQAKRGGPLRQRIKALGVAATLALSGCAIFPQQNPSPEPTPQPADTCTYSKAIVEKAGGPAKRVPPAFDAKDPARHYLLARWLYTDPAPSIDLKTVSNSLRQNQRPEGSWSSAAHPDLAGNPSATLHNYIALKLIGEDPSSPMMAQARKYLLRHGGLEHASGTDKHLLAALGQYPWDRLPSVAHADLVGPWSALGHAQDSQWGDPRILAKSYLRYTQTIHPIAGLDLSELSTQGSLKPSYGAADYALGVARSTDAKLKSLINELAAQCAAGSWGPHEMAQALTQMALYAHLEQGHPTPGGNGP